MYIKYSKQASTNLGKKNIWRVTSPGTRRYYNLSVICVYTYTIHFSLVISIHFKLYGTCWSHICTDATMKRSIAFRTVPQLTLSGPGPRSPFAHSWRSGKRYCVLSTPPKVNICSHSSTSLVHYPATSEYNYRDRSIFGSLEGPFMWGACAHESKLFESILLGGPTNWLGQHNPTNIKCTKDRITKGFKRMLHLYVNHLKMVTPLVIGILEPVPKKDPGIFWCESQLTFQHLMPGPPAASPHTTAVWRYRA